MVERDHAPTKKKILKAAAKLFSESGYNKVTTREIANAVGINSAAIYYYFTSKNDVLTSLYKFYSDERRKKSPDLGELLQLAEIAAPHEVLMKTEFHYDEDIRETLDQILIIAAREIGTDFESETFIQENIFEPITKILKPLLQRMLELKKIKPFDIDALISILSYYCYSAAALNNSSFGNSPEKYQADLSYLFGLITPTENNADS